MPEVAAPASSPAPVSSPSSDSGSSSGPQPAPVTVPASGGLTDGAIPDSSSIFDGLSFDEGDYANTAKPAETTPAPEAPAAPVTPPAVAPAPPPAVAAQPTPPPAPEPTPTPAPVAQPSAPQDSSPFRPEVLDELRTPENRETLISSLAEQFTFTPEEINGLATDAAPVLQRMAARILYAASVYTLEQFQNYNRELPSRVSSHLSSEREYETHEQRFQAMWPMLKDPKYNADIAAVSARVKAQPGITQDGIYRTVGRTILAMYGIQGSPVEGATVSPTGAPVRTVAQPIPFSPAATGGGPVPSQSNGHAPGPWDGLGMDFD